MLNVSLKSDAVLECSAYGVPSPTIQWFKNGEPIYPSEYFQLNPSTGSLRILGIIGQDEGYYQCLASNELNTIQAVAQLVVQVGESDIDYHQQLSSGSNEIAGVNDYYDPEAKRKSLTTSKSPQYPSSTQPIVHLSAPAKLRLLK